MQNILCKFQYLISFPVQRVNNSFLGRCHMQSSLIFYLEITPKDRSNKNVHLIDTMFRIPELVILLYYLLIWNL